jgi:hypothetical protein
MRPVPTNRPSAALDIRRTANCNPSTRFDDRTLASIVTLDRIIRPIGTTHMELRPPPATLPGAFVVLVSET